MKQHYFIELLHFCGISDNMCDNIKPILDQNSDWINHFNEFNINPILVAIENKNLENLKLLLSYENIKNDLFSKMIASTVEIDNDEDFLRIFEYVKNDKRVNINDFLHKGKPISHFLARKSNEVLLYTVDLNVRLNQKDLKGNNLFVDLFENFDETKQIGLTKIAKVYGITKILDDSYNGLDFFSYLTDLNISQNNKNLIVEVLNELSIQKNN